MLTANGSLQKLKVKSGLLYVKGSLSLSLTEKESVADQVSEKNIQALKQVFIDERNTFAELMGKASVQQLCAVIADGKLFPDMPDSKIAYTQISGCFAREPQIRKQMLILLSQKYHDEWVGQSIP